LRFITVYADATGRHRQLAICMLGMAAIGILASTFGTSIVPVIVAFCAATIGFVVVQPLFWTLPTSYLAGPAAASGIALIGSLGNLGGFIAPTLKTAIETMFHSQRAGMSALACAGVVGIALLLSIGATPRSARTALKPTQATSC
jgi:nitrate/nitrite transporter NarK